MCVAQKAYVAYVPSYFCACAVRLTLRNALSAAVALGGHRGLTISTLRYLSHGSSARSESYPATIPCKEDRKKGTDGSSVVRSQFEDRRAP